MSDVRSVPLMETVVQPDPLSQLLAGIKEALACGFLGVTIATGFVLRYLNPLLVSFRLTSSCQRVRPHGVASVHLLLQ